MKWYAIRSGKNGVKNKIVQNWEDCKALVQGYSGAEYKSFKTCNEAMEYLKSANAEYAENLLNIIDEYNSDKMSKLLEDKN